MKKFKKAALTAASYVSVAALAIGGTVAYLTNTDYDTNVMTAGNIKIEQHEYQRAEDVAYNATAQEGDLVEFKQGKTIMPAVPVEGKEKPYTAEPTDLFKWGDYVTDEGAANGLWNDTKISNVMDKMVFVENTGKASAYYRTVIAFECPEGMEYSEGSDKEFMMNVNGSKLFTWENNGYAEIGGVRYLLMTATYNAELAADEISRPSLLQVLMTENVTNEDMELIGDTYDILVATQAMQVVGKDAAAALNGEFGEISATNNPWIGEKAAITVKNTNERLNTIEKNTAKGLTILDSSDDSVNVRALYSTKNDITGNVVVDDCYLQGTYAMNLVADETKGYDLDVTDTTFVGWVSYSGFANTTFDNCEFFRGEFNLIRAYNDTTFTNCDFNDMAIATTGGAKITLTDCTFNGEEVTKDLLKAALEEYELYGEGYTDAEITEILATITIK